MRVLALGFTALVALASSSHAFPPSLPPVDECKAAPGLTAFRMRLRQIVAKKDRQALLSMLAPDVLVSFGGEEGPKAFAETWELDGPRESELWALLTRILGLGCAASGDAFVIPSLTMQFEPEDDEDLFDKFVVISPNARLRSGPEAGSRLIATLAWDVVKAVDQSEGLQTKVRLQDGREGWLLADELYNPAYYRMVIDKRGGKWMITAFVAGD